MHPAHASPVFGIDKGTYLLPFRTRDHMSTYRHSPFGYYSRAICQRAAYIIGAATPNFYLACSSIGVSL